MTDLQAIHLLEQTLADLNRRPDADIRQQIDTRNDLAWALRDTDLKRAFTLGERAYALACALAVGEPPDQTGLACSLRIADDGGGFDPAQRAGGLGLRNIRERVTGLHGAITITSVPGGGTQLEAVFPFPAEARP